MIPGFNLSRLLFVHAIVTLMAAIVLVVMPAAIPSTVNMPLTKEQYLLCYFLAAGEMAISYLSYAGSRLKDPAIRRIIVFTILVFHMATVGLELYAFKQGETGAKIMGNVIVRIVIIVLFSYYGLHKSSQIKQT